MRDAISDEAGEVIGPLPPKVKATGQPPVDRRTVFEPTAWRFRTGARSTDSPATLATLPGIFLAACTNEALTDQTAP
ncbi:hypothetical protein O5Y_04525 [Rhodococcus erythropolis CCM2595]|nr:hypothetical protein O5Y_04525 [Rhodococcus erythropolis CCM2595]